MLFRSSRRPERVTPRGFGASAPARPATGNATFGAATDGNRAICRDFASTVTPATRRAARQNAPAGAALCVVDLTTLKTLTKVDTGQGPDGMLYDPGQHEVYTFNGRGQSATVIDAKTNAVVATVPLGGRPESGAADPKVGRVFDNIESTSEVVAIDTKAHKVVNRWPIAPGEGASGMAIDTEHQRLFLGAGGTNTMVMFDYVNGKVVDSVPIGQGVDANAFDPGLQLAFASSGDGTVTIAHEDSPSKLTVVQTLKTENRARTLTLDPTTHRIYLGSAQFVGGGGRGGITVPGSFKILVYGIE